MTARLPVVKAFLRFITKPVVSVGDAALMATAVITADAMHLAWHLPWWVVLVIVWAVTIGAVSGIGFVKGFARSVAYDVRKWRASRGR